MLIRSIAFVLLSAGAAFAQSPLYAVDFGGSLYTLDTTTGAATLIGFTGFDRLNAAAADDSGTIYASRFRITTNASDPFQLIRIDPATGAGTLIMSYGTSTGDFRGLAWSEGVLYGILEGSPDSLVTIDPVSGAITMVGGTGFGDVQGLMADESGQLFGVGVTSGGRLLSIDKTTGVATLIAATPTAGGDLQAMEAADPGFAWIARGNLQRLDLATGVATMVGAMGIADVRGLASAPAPSGCYANCDGSTVEPVLNVDDFTCFINEFAAAQNLPHEQQVTSYANCDGSTIAPALNVDDFTCFINEFAAGCR